MHDQQSILISRLAVRAWCINTDRIDLGGSQTTILVIRDGLLVQVTDYVDYAGVERQAAALRLIHGPSARP